MRTRDMGSKPSLFERYILYPFYKFVRPMKGGVSFDNDCKRWKAEDKVIVRSFYRCGMPTWEIAARLKRTENAIRRESIK